MIKQEIDNIKGTPQELKKFGITIGTVLILISIYLFFKQKEGAYWLLGIGSFLILSGMLFSTVLRPINKVWMILAVLMGWVMTRVILSILFFLVLTPIGIIAKISGKKFLSLNRNKNVNSYWEKRKETKFLPENYERQF